MNYCGVKTEEKLEYSQLLDEFLLGCKTEQKIGMEYERIPVSTFGGEVIPYEGDFRNALTAASSGAILAYEVARQRMNSK